MVNRPTFSIDASLPSTRLPALFAPKDKSVDRKIQLPKRTSS